MASILATYLRQFPRFGDFMADNHIHNCYVLSTLDLIKCVRLGWTLWNFWANLNWQKLEYRSVNISRC